MPVSTESSPRYQQLVERFRKDMKAGVLRPGDRLPSLKEMYAEAGVSRPTLEKAYAVLEREGLIYKQHGAGVFMREAYRAGTRGIVGICGDGFGCAGYSIYWSELLGGAREAVQKSGAQLLLLDSSSYHGWDKADGVLICDWDDRRKPRKTLPGLPLVSLLTPIDGVASAVADDFGGARQATEYLIAQGHTRIGYLHTYDDHAITHSRLAGYRKALQEAGIPPDPKWTRCLRGHYQVGQRFTTEARKNILLWLRDGFLDLKCTALLCHNDESARGVIEGLNEKGIRVPEDISIVGFDGTEYCDVVAPRLSSVEIPLREIGAAGVELLLQQIRQEAVSSVHRLLPTRFVARETTGENKQ